MKTLFALSVISLALTLALWAELEIPATIGGHMVLQRQADAIWGWDTPGTKITVFFAAQDYSATGDSDGKWMARLAPLSTNASLQTFMPMGSSTRYAWADSPVRKIFPDDGFPVTPFRSDDLFQHEH